MSHSKRKNSYKFFLGIAAAFVLPLSFYSITKYFSKDTLHLPGHYHVERVDTTTEDGKQVVDTVYHQVADIELVNQLGQKVSLNKDLKDKLLVIDFFFTTCPTICPRLTSNMAILQNAFKRTAMKQNQDIVQFISITVNPERDSFPALREYADRFNVNHDHWWFLTGDKKAIYDYARQELLLSTGPGDGGAEDFIHTEKFILLDKDRHIRGYYDGLDSLSLRDCANDIGLLDLEKEARDRKQKK